MPASPRTTRPALRPSRAVSNAVAKTRRSGSRPTSEPTFSPLTGTSCPSEAWFARESVRNRTHRHRSDLDRHAVDCELRALDVRADAQIGERTHGDRAATRIGLDMQVGHVEHAVSARAER